MKLKLTTERDSLTLTAKKLSRDLAKVFQLRKYTMLSFLSPPFYNFFILRLLLLSEFMRWLVLVVMNYDCLGHFEPQVCS